jgi:hypothetical protein
VLSRTRSQTAAAPVTKPSVSVIAKGRDPVAEPAISSVDAAAATIQSLGWEMGAR